MADLLICGACVLFFDRECVEGVELMIVCNHGNSKLLAPDYLTLRQRQSNPVNARLSATNDPDCRFFIAPSCEGDLSSMN